MNTSQVIITILLIAAVFAWYWRPKLPHQGGWLYFIGGSSGPIKVGITREETPEDRMAALQTGNPVRLQVLYALRVDDPEEAEGTAHNALMESHVGGEWYGREDALELMNAIKRAGTPDNVVPLRRVK